MIWYSAGGGGNAPPTPPGMTSTWPALNCEDRSRLKSTIACASTEYLVARASTVSLALTTTTTPCTGGMTSWSPVATASLEYRLLFDQRISGTVTWYLAAIADRSSPAATVYVNGWWLTGADVGIDTGLMIVL